MERERKKSFQRGQEETIEIRQLESKISRMDEAIQSSEAALSYRFLDQAGTDNVRNIKNKIDPFIYRNNLKTPEVIIDYKGNQILLKEGLKTRIPYTKECKVGSTVKFENVDVPM